MRYHYYSRFCKIVFAILVALPLTTMAQLDKVSYMRPSYWRPYDKTGINFFETTKTPDAIPFDGLRVRFGAGFTQQFQNLTHENPLAVNRQAPPASGTKAQTTTNHLYPIAPGFMTAQANLYMDVQLADGISLNLTTYLSARHHNEAWVKGGYLQFDKLPFKGQFWDNLMKVTTIKIGHMEINYGDAHFRRSDGGHTFYNPFMESYILDAYTTEIGGEVYLKKNGFFGMAGLTSGMIKGNIDSATTTAVDNNDKRSPSIYLKSGFDRQLNDAVRVRVSASYYHNSSSAGSGLTLYGGDRTGSNYQNVMELWKTAVYNPEKSSETNKVYDATTQASTATAFSGRLNPGFSKKVDAVMLNAFLKVKGFELFGTYENAQGRTKSEAKERTASQFAIDGVYRFGKAENLFIGARYNEATARLANASSYIYSGDVKVDRTSFAAGWFITRNVMLKGEYVIQNYNNFEKTFKPDGSAPLTGLDYRSGGNFKGYVIEAAVAF
jgi:hypothetical protein